jgi:hypothetical protein
MWRAKRNRLSLTSAQVKSAEPAMKDDTHVALQHDDIDYEAIKAASVKMEMMMSAACFNIV